MDSPHHLAIQAALNANWDEAVSLNKKIIKDEPANIDGLNRLAHAFFELGQYEQAKKFYSLALKYDTYNPIATKNLKIIQAFKKSGPKREANRYLGGNHRISPLVFLQEPGKTKVVNLIKVAEPEKLSHVYCGMQVLLTPKNRGISVVDEAEAYLGVLPDDVSHNLIRLMKGGNKYEVCVKSVRVNGLSVIIREIFRSSRFRNQPSFLEYSSSSVSSGNTDLIAAMEFKDSESDELLVEDEDPV